MTQTTMSTNSSVNKNNNNNSNNNNNNNNNNGNPPSEVNISSCSSTASSSSSSSSGSNCYSNNDFTSSTQTTRMKNDNYEELNGCVTMAKSNLWHFVCIVSVCFISYYNSTQCGMVFDDISAIRDNKDLRPNTPLLHIFLNDFWGTPIRKEQSHKSYRPLTVLTFRFNYMLHELNSFGYHVVNLILHIIVSLLYKRVCRILLENSVGAQFTRSQLQYSSFVAALLFAVHPIHTEAVTGIVGRAELLSSCCSLTAFLIYVHAVQTDNMHLPVAASHSRRPARAMAASLRAANNTRWWLLLIGFTSCLLASMLCKEQGITIAGICAAYEIFVVQQLRPIHLWHLLQQLFEEQRQRRALNASPVANKVGATTMAFKLLTLKRLAYLVGVTVALLMGRVYVMGSQLPVFTRFDNPAAAAETPARQLTYSYLIFLNVWLLLFPCDLCCDWTMGTIPLVESFSDARNLLTLITFLGLLALTVSACLSKNLGQSRILLMCLALTVLPFLPASNLFFPVGFVVAERILYMPSMGFCLLVAFGYQKLLGQGGKSSRRVALRMWNLGLKCGLWLLILTHALKTHQRNYDWRTEYLLFTSGVRVNGNNAKLFNNVGHALENEGNFVEALSYFQKAVAIQPDDIGAHINVGRTYNNMGKYTEAEAAYRLAKSLFPRVKPGESYQARIAPNHLNVFINLANLIAKNQTRLEEADHLYRQAISMRADYVQAYINRGDILMKLNRTAQAQEVYEKALLYDSENADIYYNLGVVFLEQGKSAQAHVYFNKAIELYPDHEQALLNSAILLQEMGGKEARQLSRERLYQVLEHDANNERVYFNLGMLAMDEGDYVEAEQRFKRAIHLKENFRSALFNLALLLADANRSLDAVPYLNQLIRHHPDHVKGLILLGDIYINHMKDLDAAEKCYRSILHVEPHNIQGLHNLCVVFVEHKRLAKASACLAYAHHLAPKEDYILRHWQIVQTRLLKLKQLPETSAERVAAYIDYDPQEFKVPIT